MADPESAQAKLPPESSQDLGQASGEVASQVSSQPPGEPSGQPSDTPSTAPPTAPQAALQTTAQATVQATPQASPQAETKTAPEAQKGEGAAPPAPDASPKSKIQELARRVGPLFFTMMDFLKKRGEPIDQGMSAEKKAIWKDLPLLVSGLFSKDGLTKRMSTFFFLALVVALVLPVCSLRRSIHQREVLAKRRAKLLREQARAAEEKEMVFEKRRESMISLGSFVVDLKEVSPQTHVGRTVNLVELEIVILCDEKKTKEIVAGSLDQVRSQLSFVLSTIDREELLSKEGKRRFKEQLKKSINDWLPEGKVLELYVPKLIVS